VVEQRTCEINSVINK